MENTKTMSSTEAADNILLRQATLADWADLVRLDRLIFGVYGAQEDPATIRARLEVFVQGCAVLEEARVFPESKSERTILGYLTTEKWDAVREPVLDEDPYQTHRSSGTVLNITTLAIAPEEQNRGLGVQLVHHAIAVAHREGCRQIVLETAHAAAFYERHGFIKIGERSQRDIPLHIMLYELPDDL